eukprot:scaffold17127_cov82-Skeletonema_marinoi.AAC.1
MKKAVTASSDKGEDDDDVGVLIYRECLLRKARWRLQRPKANVSSFIHHRTVTRQMRTPVNITKAKNHYQTNNAKVTRHESLP